MSNRCTQWDGEQCYWFNGQSHCVHHGEGKTCKVSGDLTGQTKQKSTLEKSDALENYKDPLTARARTGKNG